MDDVEVKVENCKLVIEGSGVVMCLVHVVYVLV